MTPSTDPWVKSEPKRLAAAASANPSSCMVAGARCHECYTVPEFYWVDPALSRPHGFDSRTGHARKTVRGFMVPFEVRTVAA